MLVNIASFAAGRFDPVNWATQLYQGVQSFATGSDPFSNFFGLSPTGVSRNPDSVFVCDCVAACQIMFLRNPASPTDQAKFTQCVGIPGKAQYAGLRGQQAHLQDYIKKVYSIPYLRFLKQWAVTMSVKDGQGQDYVPLVKARSMLMAIDPTTFTDRVLATPAFAKCAMTNVWLNGTASW